MGATLSRQRGMAEASIEAIAGWNENTQNTDYASFPAAEDVAILAGFQGADSFCLPRMLLDPVAMPEFRPLIDAIFPGLEQELEAMRQARISAFCI